jgi:hypothetical protein
VSHLLANDHLDEAIYQAGVTTAEVSAVNGRAADVAWVVLNAAESKLGSGAVATNCAFTQFA